VQKFITLTGHISDALMTIVGGPAWGAMSPEDQTALDGVLDETAACASDQIIQKEKDLVQWFKDNGVTVNEVDRTPFREATMKLHNGPDATWDQATYDKLQAIK